jgi:hypothetical protein
MSPSAEGLVHHGDWVLPLLVHFLDTKEGGKGIQTCYDASGTQQWFLWCRLYITRVRLRWQPFDSFVFAEGKQSGLYGVIYKSTHRKMLWSQRYIKSKCKVLYLLVRRRFILRLLTLVPHCLCLGVPKRDIRSLSLFLSLSLSLSTHTHTHEWRENERICCSMDDGWR